jgi:GNAT superfamily N-acetyltransferase
VTANVDRSLQIVPADANTLHIAAALRAQMAVEMGHPWDDGEFPGWQERFAEYFADRQQRGESQTFYAKVGEEVVGIALASLIDDYHAYTRGRQSGRINAVYVLSGYRRRGVAKALMNACLDWLRKKGCASARLNSSEQGLPLYEAMGFKPRREMELPL